MRSTVGTLHPDGQQSRDRGYSNEHIRTIFDAPQSRHSRGVCVCPLAAVATAAVRCRFLGVPTDPFWQAPAKYRLLWLIVKVLYLRLEAAHL